MAVKTITIDLEAYEILSRRKKTGQSFSDVIKGSLGRRKTGLELQEAVARTRLSADTLDAIERQLRARRKSAASRARL